MSKETSHTVNTKQCLWDFKRRAVCKDRDLDHAILVLTLDLGFAVSFDTHTPSVL